MNIGELLTRTARWMPAAPAITWKGRTETYRNSMIAPTRSCATFGSSGLQSGDRVGVYMWNRPELHRSDVRLLQGGFCIVPLNARFSTDEVAYHVTDAGMSVLLADVDHGPTARDAAGDAALVIVDGDLSQVRGSLRAPERTRTSSTAAISPGSSTRPARRVDPKGAMLTHASPAFITVSWLADLVPLDRT